MSRAFRDDRLTVALKGDGADPAYEEFIRKSLKEMQVNAGIQESEVVEEAGPLPVAEKGIQNWFLTLAIALLLDKRFALLTSSTIENFLRDVHLYISDRNTTREINAIVAAKLTSEPTIIVAHSLGTVVAYSRETNENFFVPANDPNFALQPASLEGIPAVTLRFKHIEDWLNRPNRKYGMGKPIDVICACGSMGAKLITQDIENMEAERDAIKPPKSLPQPVAWRTQNCHRGKGSQRGKTANWMLTSTHASFVTL